MIAFKIHANLSLILEEKKRFIVIFCLSYGIYIKFLSKSFLQLLYYYQTIQNTSLYIQLKAIIIYFQISNLLYLRFRERNQRVFEMRTIICKLQFVAYKL
jgi:hypothetical protein